MRRMQKCDTCGAEHQGRYMFYSFYPGVVVNCRRCAYKLNNGRLRIGRKALEIFGTHRAGCGMRMGER